MKKVVGASSAAFSAAALLGLLFAAQARASLVKPNGAPSLDTPSTLGIALRAPADVETASAPTRARESGSCAAVAVRLPSLGTRIVTARHCAEGAVSIYDEHHHVAPAGHEDVSPGIDIALLDIDGRVPWPGLEARPGATLEPGERVCAFRVETRGSGFARERICARVLGRVSRPGGPSLIETSHPYPPGTSGSALVDRKGKVVGIVVASTGASGLAEPIDSLLAWAERAKLARKTLRHSSTGTSGNLR